MNTVSFHHIEQGFLTNTSFLLEEVMFWICSCYISSMKSWNKPSSFCFVFIPDDFLTCTLSSKKGRILCFVLRLMSPTENLPGHPSEMMRNTLTNQLLQLQRLAQAVLIIRSRLVLKSTVVCSSTCHNCQARLLLISAQMSKFLSQSLNTERKGAELTL